MAFLLSSLSACSEFLSGKPLKEDYVELKNDGSLSCLNDVSADIQKFFNAESSNETIDTTFNCFNSTLTEFQTRVEGRAQADAFNAEELYQILNKFVQQANLSRDAAKSILLLKAAVLGGDSAKITKAEINDLKTYLGVVKTEAKSLQPFLKLLTFEKPASGAYTKTFINDGFAQLNLSIKNLYKASRFASSTYSFEDFKNLILNLNVLKNDQSSLVKIANKLNTVINGTAALSESDRLAYIDNITEVLRLYEIVAQGYVDLAITTPANLTETLNFADNLVLLLENSLPYKKSRLIPAAAIDALLTEVANSSLLSFKISASSLITFYKTVVVRVLETGVNGVPTLSGIGKTHIINLKREIAVLRIYSNMLEEIAGPTAMAQLQKTRLPISYVQQRLKSLWASTQASVLNNFDYTVQNSIINQVEEMKAEFLADSPTIYRYKKMVIAANQETWDQNWEDLATGMFNKMLARLLLVGWGVTPTSKEIKTAYLTEANMIKWYAEFKDFGIAVKFFDPRVDNLGSGNFAAANLFTRSGNGDAKMTFKETIENLGGLISGGQTYSEMKVDLIANRCQMPELDIKGEHWNYESCVYTVLKAKYKVYFSNLSYLVAYLDTLTDAQFKTFFQGMVDVSRNSAANKGIRLESTDISGLNTLLYFMEATYATHDTNRNWALSEPEIRTAYPKFQTFATDFARSNSGKQIKQFTSLIGTIAGYGCFKEADLIRESFIFLVYNGRTPKQSDLSFLPCFLGKPLIKFSGEVNRMRIIEAFKVIKTALGS